MNLVTMAPNRASLVGTGVSFKLSPVPGVPAWTGELHPSLERIRRGRALGGYQYRTDLGTLGSFLDDIWNFIKDIINYCINIIKTIIARIMEFFSNPLGALRKLLQTMFDFMSGKMFLDLLATCPLTRWLFNGIDVLTGGFLTSYMTLISLPGKVVGGEGITRADLLKSLGLVKIALVLVATVATGGLILAAAGASTTLLQNGVLGETELGHFLLGLAGAVGGALLNGASLIDAFAKDGLNYIREEAVDATSNVTHVPANVLDIGISETTNLIGGNGFSYDAIKDKGGLYKVAGNVIEDPSAITNFVSGAGSGIASAVVDAPGAVVTGVTAVPSVIMAVPEAAASAVIATPGVLVAGAGAVASGVAAIPSVLVATPGAVVDGATAVGSGVVTGVSAVGSGIATAAKAVYDAPGAVVDSLSSGQAASATANFKIPGVDLTSLPYEDLVDTLIDFLDPADQAKAKALPRPSAMNLIKSKFPQFNFDFPALGNNFLLYGALASALVAGVWYYKRGRK